MLPTAEIPRLPLLIETILSVVVAVIAPKGKRTVAFLGCTFAGIGIIFLAAGHIPQRWHAGPPVEGSLATFGSLVIVLIGLYIIFLAFSRRSRDHTQTDGSKEI
jgi:hypothetical protein